MRATASVAVFVLLVTTLVISTGVFAEKGEANGDLVNVDLDGRAVTGLLWGRGNYGVVLSHGAAYDAASWAAQAKQIAAAGMTVLAVDDVSPDTLNTAGRYLKETRRQTAVALIGASAGGATALDAVAAAPELWDRLILLSPVGGDLGSLGTVPTLLVASEGEAMTDRLREFAGQSVRQDTQLFILPGSAHAQAIFRTPAGDELMEKILAWLAKRHTSVNGDAQ